MQTPPHAGPTGHSADPHDREYSHTIDGHAETSPSSFAVIDPATAEPFARCPDATAAQLDAAVAAARRAAGPWAALSFEERRHHLHRFGEALTEHNEAIARLLSREQGKPVADSRGEVTRSVHHLEALTAIKLADQVVRDNAASHLELRYRPLGVVGAITPWNVPVILAMHKIAQGLYTGNTMVMKPSPYTPLATLLLGEISREILPPGVFNVVAGGNDLGRLITEHPDIDGISFTGSGPTGKKIMASASGTLKRVTLELGGNDAALVLDDADRASAVASLFRSAFYNAGQICFAVKRIYVHESIFEPFAHELAAMARAMAVGDAFDPEAKMGPLQNRMQYDKVLEILEDAKRRPGVEVLAGGHALNRPGYFIAPTVITGVAEGSRLVDEEQFGPVIPVLKFSSLDDAIRRANATRFGLGASVWTGNEARGMDVAGRLEAGTVWVNRHGGADPDAPYGGMKESGLGREQGLLGLQAYMEPRVVSVTRGAAFDYTKNKR